MLLSIVDQLIKLVDSLFDVFLSILGIIIFSIPLALVSVGLVAWLAFFFFQKQRDIKDIQRNLFKFIISTCSLLLGLWSGLLSSFMTPYFTSLGFIESGFWGFVVGATAGFIGGIILYFLIYFKLIKNFYFKAGKVVVDSKVLLER
jgi:hypothetical protein